MPIVLADSVSAEYNPRGLRYGDAIYYDFDRRP